MLDSRNLLTVDDKFEVGRRGINAKLKEQLGVEDSWLDLHTVHRVDAARNGHRVGYMALGIMRGDPAGAGAIEEMLQVDHANPWGLDPEDLKYLGDLGMRHGVYDCEPSNPIRTMPELPVVETPDIEAGGSILPFARAA